MSKDAREKTPPATDSRKKFHLRCTVEAKDAGLRIDQFLHGACPEFSRGFWKKALAVGSVHHEGRRISQCSRTVRAGDNVEVFLDGRPLEKFSVSEDQVLFRDKYLLVLNKPPGLDTQPTPARYQGTLYQGVLDYLGRSRAGGRKLDVGMVQRLDRDTSGAIVFSIHPRAHRGLSQQMQQRQAGKTYLAIVCGGLDREEGEFASNLARIRSTNLVRSVARGGKPALTRFSVLQTNSRFTLVEVELVTGRMHQIRAHFAEAGHPLLGDERYGGLAAIPFPAAKSQMLHSWRLRLTHPVTGQGVDISAPLPASWQDILEGCGFSDNLPGKLDFCG